MVGSALLVSQQCHRQLLNRELVSDPMDAPEFSPALIDVLGIEDFTKSREFGRERGLNPVLSEMSKKNLEELTQRLNYNGAVKPKKGTGPTEDDEDIAVTFDIKSEPRVVLNKGFISTKSEFICPFSSFC